MKRLGAAMMLAAVIAGAGVAAPASASAAQPAQQASGMVQLYGNWPHT
ncbi:hypothetical protein [Arthrobacter zhaoxinii]|nr:hypothetical protein [Arthrobacter zhaoxinii]MCQ2001799.1 hypothetical protein [Arthrobacter zhaoxinii]